MKIGFIIVLFHTPENEVKRLKKEVILLGLKNYTLYLIDNTDTGKGYAQGVNEGLRKGLEEKVDYFVIANPDISLGEHFAKKLLDGRDHFGIWGGAMKQHKITYYGGELDKRRVSGGLVRPNPASRFTFVDFVSGALIIVSVKTVQVIGYFDEGYGMYYEDVDYCTKAKKAGLKVGVDTELKYHHFETSNTSPNKDWYLFKNRIKFLLKHGSVKQKIWEIFYIPKTILEFLSIIFKHRKFLRNFTSMSLSSVLNRFLTFLLFINLVKLLPPSQYGQYVLVWAHVAILMPLLDLGTTTYSIVKLPNQKETAFFDIFSLRLLLSAVVFLSTLILAFFLHYEKQIIFYVALTGAAIFANSMSGSFLIISSLKQKLHLPSIVSVLFQIVVIITLTLTLFLRYGIGPLFSLICILYVIYAFINFVLIIKEFSGKLKIRFTPIIWKNIIRESYVYVLIGMFAGIYYGADIFLLKFLKGSETVGTYSAGYKFFDAFMFLAANYSVAATPILAKLKESNLLGFIQKIKRDSFLIFGLGLLVVIGMWLFAPLVLPLILKGEYAVSIQVLKIVILALPFLLATTVFLNGLYLFNRQKWVIILFLFQVIFNIAANIIFIPQYSFFAASYITVICEIINTGVSGLLLFSVLKNYES